MHTVTPSAYRVINKIKYNKPREAARSKAYVCGRSLARTVGSNPTRGMDVCLLWVLCCQVEVSAAGWSLVQSSPTECVVSECDREASIMRPWSTRVCCAMWKNNNNPMEDSTLWDANSSSVKEVPAFYGTWCLMTMFIRIRPGPVLSPNPITLTL